MGGKVRPGKILFEIDGVSKNLAMSAFELASANSNKNKICFKAWFIMDKFSDLLKIPVSDLKNKIADLRKESLNLRFQKQVAN